MDSRLLVQSSTCSLTHTTLYCSAGSSPAAGRALLSYFWLVKILNFSTGVGVYNKLFLRSDRDLSVAKSLMDSCLGDHEWIHLDLDGKCKLLQRSIVEANTAAYGGARPKPVRKVIQLRKLRKERQRAENRRNKLSVERAKKKLRMRHGHRKTRKP